MSPTLYALNASTVQILWDLLRWGAHFEAYVQHIRLIVPSASAGPSRQSELFCAATYGFNLGLKNRLLKSGLPMKYHNSCANPWRMGINSLL